MPFASVAGSLWGKSSDILNYDAAFEVAKALRETRDSEEDQQTLQSKNTFPAMQPNLT